MSTSGKKTLIVTLLTLLEMEDFITPYTENGHIFKKKSNAAKERDRVDN